MMRKFALLGLALLVSACGGRSALVPQQGKALPVKPVGATQTPTAEQLMTPETQARPKRNDEQLTRSEKRQDDKFDLPPDSPKG
jgi:hypothetical protein